MTRRPAEPDDLVYSTFERVEVLQIPPAPCPSCGSTHNLRNKAPLDQGDGSLMIYLKCGACGRRFRQVVE